MGVRSYFIQYKFIIPENLKHSSYTYQKLFRALYGYTQAVYKSSGKVYHYHREGVLSGSPYIRPGKNCVIIPPAAFQRLIEFFKTGKNPAHKWRGKGDWKAVYYMNEKDVNEREAVAALEAALDRRYILTKSAEHAKLTDEINLLLRKDKSGVEKAHTQIVLSKAQSVVDSEWFKTLHTGSDKLSDFYAAYKKLKNI